MHVHHGELATPRTRTLLTKTACMSADPGHYRKQVQAACGNSHTPIAIRGSGNSKAFYGRTTAGTRLSPSKIYTRDHLIIHTIRTGGISARAGYAADRHSSPCWQQDRPDVTLRTTARFGETATVGGSRCLWPVRTAAALHRGGARLRARRINCINGKGETLRLGGQVMKNVAGYDLSRGH